MKNFLLSLKTTVWTLLVLVCLFFVGSYLMPAHREVFGSMNDDILLTWTIKTASSHLGETWWLFGVLAGLILLTANTLVCSIETIRARLSRADFFIRISPQVIHIGFLFILLAHLLSAGWGYKLSGTMPQGAFAQLPGNRQLSLDDIRVASDDSGSPRDWEARVSVYQDGGRVQTGVLAPNRPLLYDGIAIYLKTLTFEDGPAAVLLVTHDPGAVWALVGGIIFILGCLALLVLKWKKA